MPEPEKFARKPFNVEVMKVREDNIDEVAAWAKGTVKVEGDKKYIKVKVHQPKNERQTKAYVGDRVLLSTQGFKVYTEKAFLASFEPAVGVVEK